MKITVTADDIKNGEIGEACACPVALALQRVGFDKAIVTNGFIFPHGAGDDAPVVRQPGKVYTFVKNFDLGKKVSPFKFDLKIKEIDHAV